MNEIEELKLEIKMLKSIINAIDDHLNDTRLSNIIIRLETDYRNQIDAIVKDEEY